MSANETTPHEHDSSKAERILEIDDEIAALKKIEPKKALYVSLLVPLLVLLFTFVTVVAASPDAWLRVIANIWPVLALVALPSAVFSIQMIKNRSMRHRLDRELDELIAEPVRRGLKPGSGD